MNIRLYHAKILTMEPGREIFEGEVQVRGGKITYVGESPETGRRPGREQASGKEREPGREQASGKERRPGKDRTPGKDRREEIGWEEEIDCGGNLLMPGFKNAHTHSAMTFLRSYADDIPLQEWLHNKIFPAEAKLTPEDIYGLTKLAVLEYLTSGVTAIFDMYINPGAVARACTDTGMRCVLVSGLNDFTSSVRQMEEEYREWNGGHALISYRLGFHAEYTCSQKLLSEVAELAGGLRAPVYAHMSETKTEVEACRARYGRTPIAFLDSLGMFAYGGGGFHCVHVTQEDIDVLRQRNMWVVTNPASNLKLASGVAPIKRFVDAGIPVAIGTDGPASNNCLDMFREMFLASGLAKLREEDAACLKAERVLHMATVQGAGAMGLEDADVLAPGKQADLILIDLQQPNMQPVHNIPRNLVYSGSKQNVAMTMIGGRILYRNGRFDVGEEPEKIYRTANQIVKRMLLQ